MLLLLLRGPCSQNHLGIVSMVSSPPTTLFRCIHRCATHWSKSVPLGATSLTWKYCVADASSVRWLNTEYFFFSFRHLFKVFENALNSARKKKQICVYALEITELATALYKIPTEKILEDYNSTFITEHRHEDWQGGNEYHSEVWHPYLHLSGIFAFTNVKWESITAHRRGSLNSLAPVLAQHFRMRSGEGDGWWYRKKCICEYKIYVYVNDYICKSHSVA